MASQLADVASVDLETVRKRLRELVRWRDLLAAEVAKVDAAIRDDARTFATLNGDKMRPTLDQLRRMVAEPPPDIEGSPC
jgi:hypothetical protein